MVSTCNLLLFSDSQSRGLKKDDSHACALLPSFLVVPEIQSEINFYARTYFWLLWHLEEKTLSINIFCVPTIYIVLWRLKMHNTSLWARKICKLVLKRWDMNIYLVKLQFLVQDCKKNMWQIRWWPVASSRVEFWSPTLEFGSISEWQGVGFIRVGLLATAAEWDTQTVAFLKIWIVQSWTLKIRQLVVQQVSGTLRLGVRVQRSQLPLFIARDCPPVFFCGGSASDVWGLYWRRPTCSYCLYSLSSVQDLS